LAINPLTPNRAFSLQSIRRGVHLRLEKGRIQNEAANCYVIEIAISSGPQPVYQNDAFPC
jgi:hypothetical protein